MRDLKISLLGPLTITVNEKPIEVVSNYVRALLLFLVVEKHHPHRREALAEMFWPDKPEGVARNSLKQALSNLRSALEEHSAHSPFLLVARDEIQFNQSSLNWVDIEEFAEFVNNAANHPHEDALKCTTCENWLLRAAELYRGDFLADFYLPDNQDFNDWVILKREAYQRQMSDVLCQLAQIHEARGEFVGASDYCRQLAALEPWNEENHRDLMRLLALSGMRSAALRQYQICCDSLENELGVEPAEATTALYEEIKAWQPENFPGDEPLLSTASSAGQTSDSKNDGTKQSITARHRPRMDVFFLGILLILLGVSAVSWLAANKDPKTEIPIVVVQDGVTSIPTVRPTATFQATPVSMTSSSASISALEISALETLYNQTGGSHWENAEGWLSELSPCQWYGVTCRGGKIVALELTNNQLSGTIPAEIGQLAYLENLDLRNNQLSGNIPSTLGNLSNLRQLYLSGNRQLSGPIPPELGNLSKLEILELAHWENGGSLLSGEIPSELGNLKNLRDLSISVSLLQGPLPVELCTLTKLEALAVEQNRLSGQIPPEIGNLTNLGHLDLGSNDFEGSIPPELGNLTMLTYLSFGGDLLSGEIPAELGNLVRLRYLVLDNTNLSGPLPLSLMNLNLRELTFWGTDVCEPKDEAFQAWLDSIGELQSNEVVCPPESY